MVGGDDAGAAGGMDGLDDAAEAGIDGLDRLTAASITPVWPTMSEFAKLMIENAGFSAAKCSTNASVAATALISGFLS